jgi:hypothetical protein
MSIPGGDGSVVECEFRPGRFGSEVETGYDDAIADFLTRKFKRMLGSCCRWPDGNGLGLETLLLTRTKAQTQRHPENPMLSALEPKESPGVLVGEETSLISPAEFVSLLTSRRSVERVDSLPGNVVGLRDSTSGRIYLVDYYELARYQVNHLGYALDPERRSN